MGREVKSVAINKEGKEPEWKYAYVPNPKVRSRAYEKQELSASSGRGWMTE